MAVSAPEKSPSPVQDGVIEEARRRRHGRRVRMALVGTVLVAGIGALLASTTGHSTPVEAPLHLPPENTSAATLRSIERNGIGVVLRPDLEGSMAGWCVQVITNGGITGTCPPLPTRAHPFLETGTGWSTGEHDDTTVVVTSPDVAQVLFDKGLRAPTLAMPGLPDGMRAAILHSPRSRIPRAIKVLAALNSSGQVLSRSPDYGDGIPFRDWNRPSAPAEGPCQLHVTSGLNATAEWGQIARSIHPYPGRIVGQGFLSCVDTEYYIPGRGMRAAVLLDAANPGHTPPASIPGLTRIPQVPGFYDTAKQFDLLEQVTAKREGDAWIVVAGGGRNAEESRVRLLRHLTATVRL